MKLKLLLVFLFFSIAFFAQSDVYYFKDTTGNLTYKNIAEEEFKLLEKQISEKHSNDVYWFKIPAYKTDSKYIFKIIYERINKAEVYQNYKKIEKLKKQRFLSYKFTRDYDVYVKVSPKLHSYIPVELAVEEKSIFKNDSQLLLNGFYYGFTFLVIILNFSYYILFKDEAFLYYSLFLTTMAFGLFSMDGMLNFYDVNESLNDFLIILNYIFLAFFSAKFVNSYLFLENYYPKIKTICYSLGFVIIIMGVLYLIFKDFYYFLFLNIFVFSVLFIYWFSSLLLFRKNIYTKFLTFAYIIILFSGIDYFILKLLGVSLINIDATNIKIGAFLEMITLSFAVLYRMKVLTDENKFMRNEIRSYSSQLLDDAVSSEKEDSKNNVDDLSQRERQIFNLIASGKTNKELANELNISVNTVKFHVKNIYGKLNIKSRKEALIIEIS